MVGDPFLARFPGLAGGYRITSPATPAYNCIAWAAGRTDKWWWPNYYGFWPSGAPFEATLPAFEAAFTTLGYVRCSNESLEHGYEKIAIYVDASQVPTHAARQLQNGRWTSKLGPQVDIEHMTPDALTSNVYGSPVLTMRRSTKLTQTFWRWVKSLLTYR